jgi:hypothetical protein
MLPLLKTADCNASGVIYILLCKKCNYFYIGETAKKRIYSHLNKIKNFKPFSDHMTEVGFHFNLREHSTDRDFRFAIFNKDIAIKDKRLSIEADLKNIFRSFGAVVINSFIRNINGVKYASFG